MGVSTKRLLIEALQCLLIARVLAAPVALLAQGGGDCLTTVLVVRASAWAAHESRLSCGRAAECRATRAEVGLPATKPLVIAAAPLPRSGSPPFPLIPVDTDSRRSPSRLRC